MASEYELKLRATLDTSDVKKQLDSLKQSTKAQTTQGGNAPGGNLGVLLRNLNTTLQNLQRSIDRLTAQGKAQVQHGGGGRNNGTFVPNPLALPMRHGAVQGVQNHVKEMVQQRIDYYLNTAKSLSRGVGNSKGKWKTVVEEDGSVT